VRGVGRGHNTQRSLLGVSCHRSQPHIAGRWPRKVTSCALTALPLQSQPVSSGADLASHLHNLFPSRWWSAGHAQVPPATTCPRECVATIGSQGCDSAIDRYCNTRSHLWAGPRPRVHNGKRWVLSNQWGTKTEPTLSALSDAFPEAKVTSDKLTGHPSADQDHDLRLVGGVPECVPHSARLVDPGRPARTQWCRPAGSPSALRTNERRSRTS
jgi:hypothetical protein